MNSPGRQAGVENFDKMSTEGAALFCRFFEPISPFPVRWGMAGKYLSVKIHFVWSTKGRRSLIDLQWRHRLMAFMGSVARCKGAKLIEANGQPDHIHAYISMPSTISIASLVNALKANSTRWIRQTFPNRRWFSWQEGYAGFSVSPSREKAVIEYIRTQDEHHKRRSFEQELLELLRCHGIEYDPRYVFD